MTPRDFIAGFITDHEGTLSLDPADNGNWAGGKRGIGTLVGSKFGITAKTLATYHGIAVSSVTAADIAAIDKQLAVDIGLALYFAAPGFSRLPWNRVTASIVDKGWMSGPGQATKLMQRMIGVNADGAIGPQTIAAFDIWYAKIGEEAGAKAWAAVREAFDHMLATNEGPGDPDAKYEGGWDNRTRSFLPGTSWWRAWA